jgi:hypothetical protein
MSKLKIALLVIIGVVGIILNGLWLHKSGKMPSDWANFLGMGNIPISEEQAVKSGISAEETAIDEWVDRLGERERCDPLGTPDGGSLSYGRFCFKRGTFTMFVKKYNLLPQCEDEEIMNWINDSEFQERLTKIIITNNPEDWRHWKNSVMVYRGRKGIGLPPNI